MEHANLGFANPLGRRLGLFGASWLIWHSSKNWVPTKNRFAPTSHSESKMAVRSRLAPRNKVKQGQGQYSHRMIKGNRAAMVFPLLPPPSKGRSARLFPRSGCPQPPIQRLSA